MKKRFSKSSTSAEMDESNEMKGVPTHSDRLESLRIISDPNDPGDMKTLKEYEKLDRGVGCDNSINRGKKTKKIKK